MTPIELEFKLTPAAFQAVRRHFAEHHVEVPDEASGEIEQSGVKARFTYDGQVLRVTVYDKPFLATDSLVIAKLTDFIESTLI